MSRAIAPAPATAGTTVGRLRRDVAARLGGAALDARLLVAAALGLDGDRLPLLDEQPVSPSGAAAAWRLAERRKAGEPVSRILGRRAFWTFEIGLNRDTLDPRADTETLVEAALERLAGVTAPTVLDLGTGSGAILLAILSERPDASGVGIDLAPGAAAMALSNARRLGLADRALFVAGDWAEALASGFDAIVANPPYIRSADIAALQPEVRGHDPPLALDGGADGLTAYRRIVADLCRLLNPGGFAVFEVGAGQAAEVIRLSRSAGFATCIRKDLAGLERAVTLVQTGRETAAEGGQRPKTAWNIGANGLASGHRIQAQASDDRRSGSGRGR